MHHNNHNKSWFNTFCLKFNITVLVVFTFCCLTVYNISYFCSKFRFLIAWIIQQVCNLLCFHFIWYSQNFVEIKKFFLLNFQWWKTFLLHHLQVYQQNYFTVWNQSFLIQFVCLNLLQILYCGLKSIHKLQVV